MSASAKLPFSSAAGDVHARSMMSPDIQAKTMQALMSGGWQVGQRNSCLTSAVVNCTRKGVRAAGFLDNFELFRQKENRIEEKEWQNKKRWVDTVRQWGASEEGGRLEWFPIIYTYLLSKHHLGGEADNFGGLIMADAAMERFLIINYYDMDDFPKYHALNERRAKELMSLLLYLGVPRPKWVRSTYMVPYGSYKPDALLPLATLDAMPTSIPPLAANPSRTGHIQHPVVHLNSHLEEEFPAGIPFPSFARIERLLEESFGGSHS
ncbi:hypothetical protein RQP46_006311 [Phenoliferia psychrophenolica]